MPKDTRKCQMYIAGLAFGGQAARAPCGSRWCGMSDMPTLRSGDVILLATGAVVRLLSTDYRSMIVMCEDGNAREVRCSEYVGLLKQAAYSLDDTQPMPAYDRLVTFWNTVE